MFRASVLLIFALLVLSLVPSQAQNFFVYTGGALQNGFQDWSWAKTYSLHDTTRSHSGGGACVSWNPTNFDAVYFHAGATAPPFAGSLGLEFWVFLTDANSDFSISINPGTGGPSVQLSTLLSSSDNAETTGTELPTGTWINAFVPFSDYPVVPSGDTFIQVWFQAVAGSQGTVFLDEISLSSTAPPAPTPPPLPPPNWDEGPIVGTVTVTLDSQASKTPISELIYGVNFAPNLGLSKAKYTANRNGGNAASRFNWEQSIHNTASDWFFENIAESVKNVSILPEGNSIDQFIDATKSSNANTRTLITVNMIGFAPLDDRNTKAYSYSIQKYGDQTNNECAAAGNPSWCNKDIGNGVSASTNQPILGPNIWQTTSKRVDETYNVGLLKHLKQRGTLPDFVLLDNEPMLWKSTHFDVWPEGLTYDGLWNRSQITATAIKKNFPDIKIVGPSVWGWCAYFFSSADGCSCGDDCKSHNSLPLLEYYLQQNCQNSGNSLLVDYLDIHYYPQASGVSSGDDSAATRNFRSRAAKSLYDSGYVDESWINQQIYLIPRMKGIINKYCPNVKFSISEYSFGGDDLASAALANAEALAIFGREGVDMACKWTSPAVGTRTENAFKFYTNYDNVNGNLVDSAFSVNGNSSNIDLATIYGIYSSSTNDLYVLLFNKDPGTGRVTVNGMISGIPNSVKSAARFSFGKASSQVVPRDDVAINNGIFSVELSIYEATILKVYLG